MPLRGRESGRKSGVVTSAKLRRPELNPKDRVAAGKPGPGRTGAPDMSRSRVLLSHPLTHSLTLPTTRHALAEAGHRTSAVFIGAQIWAPASSLDALDAMEWLTTTTTTTTAKAVVMVPPVPPADRHVSVAPLTAAPDGHYYPFSPAKTGSSPSPADLRSCGRGWRD